MLVTRVGKITLFSFNYNYNYNNSSQFSIAITMGQLEGRV